jgi:hypothetical protein
MNIEKTIHGLLALDECWEVQGVDHDSETEKFFMFITETDKIWQKRFVPINPANRLGSPITITPIQGLGDICMYWENGLKLSPVCLAAYAYLVNETIELKFPGRVKENILLKLLKDLHWR